MKIYKFRPLRNEDDLCRIKQILETGNLWCSPFFDLNDPMEGIFRSYEHIVDEIFSQKCKFKICSFSGKKAFENPIMWGYYANGFKGVAIEVEVKDGDVKVIDYQKKISEPASASEENVRKILCRKLDVWGHEDEYRFLTKEGSDQLCKIGKVTKVFLGKPFNHAHNMNSINGESKNLQKYENLANELVRFSIEKEIPHSEVIIDTENNKVKELTI